MAKQQISVDVPEGWIGVEYRPVRVEEWYLGAEGPARSKCNTIAPWLILRKIEPVRESRWENLYPLGSCRGMRHIDRSLADETATVGRCAIIRIDYENNVPVNVALEPAEGGGA